MLDIYKLARRYGHHVTRYGVSKFLKACEPKVTTFDEMFRDKEAELTNFGWKFLPELHCLEGVVTLHRAKRIEGARSLLQDIIQRADILLVEAPTQWSDTELRAMCNSIASKIEAICEKRPCNTQGRTLEELVREWKHYRTMLDVKSYTSSSETLRNQFVSALKIVRVATLSDDCIGEQIAAALNNVMPELKATASQQWQKVIRKILKISGFLERSTETITKEWYDQSGMYHSREASWIESVYAKISDALQELDKEFPTRLSWNPEDFILASHGEVWTSCHCPDKDSIRPYNRSRAGHSAGYGGGYCAGELSYALDNTTLVLWGVGRICTEAEGIEYRYRTFRQMFHWNGTDKLCQGRFYPFDQRDSGADNTSSGLADYDTTRKVVQTLICIGLGNTKNQWELLSESTDNADYIHSDGYQYEDYFHYDNCNVTQLVDATENRCYIHIGTDSIRCLGCGKKWLDDSGWFVCSDCRGTDPDEPQCHNCGAIIDDVDSAFVDANGNYYCDCCTTTCSECGATIPIDAVEGLCSDCYINAHPERYQRCACGCGQIVDMHNCDSTEVYIGNGQTEWYFNAYHAPRYGTLRGIHVLSSLISRCPVCGDRAFYEGSCRACGLVMEDGNDADGIH